MPLKQLVIATRGSRLALWQAESIATEIRSLSGIAGYDIEVSLLVVKTTGDSILDLPLAKIGGKGLFVKEIEEALLDGRADLAVHSMKDLPMELPEGLTLGAMPRREDPSDVLLSATSPGIAALPSGAQIGTSSLRRQAQILARRPDVRIVSLRGNIDTRLRKLREGQFDAIVMAAAGIRRLGLTAPYMERLAPPRFLPAAGQGALGLEFRADRADLAALLAPLEDLETRLCVEAERGFLFGLNGSCQVPIAAHAVLDEDGSFTLHGLVAHTDGSVIVARSATLPSCPDTAAARTLGLELAVEVFEGGGRSVLNTVLYSTDAPID